MIAIVKKELRTYFVSLTGYIFLGFFVFLTGVFFSLGNVDYMSANYGATLSQTAITFLVLIPALTMRLFADEARQKTDQLLFTSPLKVRHIVLGKFLAAYLLFLLAMLITMIFPLLLSRYGQMPTAAIAGAFFAYMLLGACYISIGVYIAALTESQIVAALGSFAALLALFVIDALTAYMPVDRLSSAVFLGLLAVGVCALLYNSTKSAVITGGFGLLGVLAGVVVFFVNPLAYDGVIGRVLQWFSVAKRFDGFANSIFSVPNIIYYITFAAAFVYLTVNTIEKRRWK